jgi:hypothetical protein
MPVTERTPLSCAAWLAALADMSAVLGAAPEGCVPPDAAAMVHAARRTWSLAPVATLGTPRPCATLRVVSALADIVAAATATATPGQPAPAPAPALVAWAGRAGVALLGLVLHQWQVDGGHWLAPGCHKDLVAFVGTGTRLARGLAQALAPVLPRTHTGVGACLGAATLSLLDSAARLLGFLTWVGVAVREAPPCFAVHAGTWALTTLAAAAVATGGTTLAKAFLPQVAMLVVQAPLGFHGHRFSQVLVPLMVQCLAAAPELGWPPRPTQIVLQALTILRHAFPEPEPQPQPQPVSVSVSVPGPVPVPETETRMPQTPPRSRGSTCRRDETGSPVLGTTLRWLHTARGPSVCDATRANVRMAARAMGISLGPGPVPPPPLALVKGLLRTETRRHLKRERDRPQARAQAQAQAQPGHPELCAICHTPQVETRHRHQHCTLQCCHQFHATCLAGYVCATGSNACPLCRGDIITKCDDSEWSLAQVAPACCIHRSTSAEMG